jgi:hypothetical protein
MSVVETEQLIESFRTELAPQEDDNTFVPLLAKRRVPLRAVGALAAEQHRIIPSDRRSFLLLAARTETGSPTGEFFAGLAGGENAALATLPALAAACGLDADAVRDYRPQPECQAYPAYLAWLTLNADPVDAALALLANFAAWGNYCAASARALREHYGFGDEACGFFDFFASSPPGAEELALAVAQEALDTGGSLDAARGYGRLIQSYELMFWNRLAESA